MKQCNYFRWYIDEKSKNTITPQRAWLNGLRVKCIFERNLTKNKNMRGPHCFVKLPKKLKANCYYYEYRLLLPTSIQLSLLKNAIRFRSLKWLWYSLKPEYFIICYTKA